ncbi:MAG: hypothetical protein JRM77_08320, partial [Nitrososphaerota archaeon]|nr:hypothetical protein [Nitrososphaerota archaeon]
LNATILNTILDVNVTSQSSNINVNLAAQSSNINVNLAASGITLTVSVSGTPNVNIASQSSNLNVAIAANNAGNLTVSLAAIATTANLNVNLNASAITLNVNITNASITITGSVSISGVPAVTINAGSAVIGSISEIVSPVTARTVLGFGYQESVAFLNYSGSGFFMSGSAADSSANQLLSNESWTQTVLATSSGGIGYASIATLQKVSSALSVWGMQGAVVTNSSGSHSFQALGAIYSDNAGSMGNLIAQTQLAAFSVGDVAAGTIINFAVFFAAPVSLSANTSYFFAFTILQTNGTSELYLNLISSGTGYYSNSSFVYGFPSASSWTSFTGSTSVVLLSSAGTTVSNPVNVTQTIEATETLNGQLVFKVGASAPNQAFIGISSFTYTIQDSTTGEYLVNARTVNTVNAGQGLVSVTDSVSLSSVTLNSGDSFVVTISSITVFGGAADGSTGYASVYFDSLDGISYLVLPLK